MISSLLAGDWAGGGRLFSDFDILVPKNWIEQVEKSLNANGWVETHQNDYDQRYYREWMHELPPMVHLKRQTTLDVHYNILPEVGRVCPDVGQMFNRAVKLGDGPVRVLSLEDRVIHSAAHLFHNGELEQGLRDLSDMELLPREPEIRFLQRIPRRGSAAAFEINLVDELIRLQRELIDDTEANFDKPFIVDSSRQSLPLS